MYWEPRIYITWHQGACFPAVVAVPKTRSLRSDASSGVCVCVYVCVRAFWRVADWFSRFGGSPISTATHMLLSPGFWFLFETLDTRPPDFLGPVFSNLSRHPCFPGKNPHARKCGTSLKKRVPRFPGPCSLNLPISLRRQGTKGTARGLGVQTLDLYRGGRGLTRRACSNVVCREVAVHPCRYRLCDWWWLSNCMSSSS